MITWSLLLLVFSGDVELDRLARQARAHVRFLAADALEGRETTYLGQKVAAHYIAAHFERIGLEPIVPESETPYFQAYDLVVKEFAPGSVSLTVKGSGPQVELEPFRDAFLRPRGDSGPVYVKEPLAFAGYGLKTDDYDDFEDLDLKGKWVVVLDGQPPAREGGKFSEEGTSRIFYSKYINAFKAEAAGLVLLKGEAAEPPPGVSHHGSPRRMKLPDGEWRGSDRAFHYMAVPRSSWRKLLGNYYDRVVAAARAIDETHEPRSFSMSRRALTYRANLADSVKQAENVAAILPGSDPALRDEYIVIGAHYDHIGVSEGRVYNGADDNASGVSVVMALAAGLPQRAPRRSVLFLLFSGEEKGLLGSKYFVRNPVVPLEKVVAMINMDMIGRNEPNAIGVIPSKVEGVSTLNAVLKTVNRDHGFELREDLDRYHRRSDHYSFVDKKVPSIFFFSDVHDDYHSPRDDWELLNYRKIARLTRLIEDLVATVADDRQRPRFLEVETDKKAAGAEGP